MKVSEFLRAASRLAAMAGIVVAGAGWYTWLVLIRGGGRRARVCWMQWMSRQFLRVLRCRVEVRGDIPRSGLIVCNHLGYLDVIVIGSACPAIFVAKSDVSGWPVFGALASMAGTLFVERGKRSSVRNQLSLLKEPLASGFAVVLFPEGTSSDGSRVLPFRSSLLEGARLAGRSIVPAALTYDLEDGDAGTEICYWGDMTFVSHLFRLLSKKQCRATLSFAGARAPSADRKQEAAWLHRRISDELRLIERQTTVC